MSTVQAFPTQQRTNPMFYAGIFSTVVVALLVTTIIIISYIPRCGPQKEEDGKTDKTTTKKKCCEGTWKRFDSSVPLTIFIVSLVIFVLALGFIYFGRSKS